MDERPGPASLAALCNALLKGREPPPARAVARLASYRWFVVGTVCIGACMGQVDSSITQLILPRLEVDFDARLSTVSWVAVAYLLTMAGFLPVFGRVADMFGRKLLYTGGFLIFVLGSALCGFAPNLPALIAFRVLQAIGAALLSSNSVAIVVTAAGPEHRGRALGIMAAAQAIGLSAGPAIGGLVLDTLGWQWVFWINVPVGLVAAVMGWFVLPPTTGLAVGERFDWTGAFLILPALTALIAAVNEAHVWGLASPAFLAGVLGGFVLLLLFVFAERRARNPLMDLALFRSGAFATGNAANLISYAMLFGLFFLMPFVFIRVYEETALMAGLRLSIVPVMLGLTAPFSGALSDRLGARLLSASGMAICAAAMALLYSVLDGSASPLAGRDAGACRGRRRAGDVHLAQQQFDHGRRAGAARRRGRQPDERDARLRDEHRHCGELGAAGVAARGADRARFRHRRRHRRCAHRGKPHRAAAARRARRSRRRDLPPPPAAVARILAWLDCAAKAVRSPPPCGEGLGVGPSL